MYFDTKSKKSGRIQYVRFCSFRRVKCIHIKHTFACVYTFHQAFFVRAAPKIGGELLVGLLTDVSRWFHTTIAYPSPSQLTTTAASDLLSQKTDKLHNHSYRIARCRSFRRGFCYKTCPGLSPDSLVQQNKDACPFHDVERVAHLPQKPDVIFSFRFMHRLRRFPHTATL